MSDPFLGQVCSFGFNFAPVGWALCNGQLLPIAQYDALFSLLGTTYGGDGQTTFGLPNLQGRASINQGQGPGLSNYSLGQVLGTESVTLSATQLPIHTHSAGAAVSPGSTNVPSSSAYLSTEGPGTPVVSTYTPNAPATQTAISGSTISLSGNSLPHENRQPLLVVNYCIALEGIYPSRN